MTRKDYVLLATAISKVSNETGSVAQVVYKIAHALKRDNPRFDFDKFLKACGAAVEEV